ncbi:MAG: 2-C-methyl-D-erythritol 4-phosphate cytidylyltransferase [Ignavibacteriaceae bacterium]|nr:2-C-methyl-D-erythritol 4-phosphate cytidylyltransferase [Ignavibacteriaceae bacterium]
MKIYALIPAGGKGKRSGAAIPKQYIKFGGKELIAYTLGVFQKSKYINEIIVACDPAYFSLITSLKSRFRISKLKKIVAGGEERQDSVYNCLKEVAGKKDDLVVVHDAARPLLPIKTLDNAILTAIRKGNSLVCIKARDTLIKGEEDVEEYVNRNKVYYVQTPQIFRYSDLLSAMKKAYDDKFIGTDESMLVKRLGIRINIVEGSAFNFKVTTHEDLELFRKLIK